MRLEDCDKIYSAALATEREDQFAGLCSELLVTYRMLTGALGRGMQYWRARIIEESPYSNIRDLTYPPPNKARSGRLSRAGDPRFYISSNAETAVKEVLPSRGQQVQLAGYTIRCNEAFRVLLIGEYAHVRKRGYTSLNGTDPDGVVRDLLRRHPQQAEIMVSIDKFFAAVLADLKASENGYMRTQTLAKLLHDRRSDADGILFPSVRDDGGFNFGVLANAADRLFENSCCTVQLVGESYMYGMLKLETLKSAIAVDDAGDFVWPDVTVPGQWYRYGLSPEELEAKSAAGGRIGESRIGGPVPQGRA